jgi:hypothetical protein
MVFVYGVLRHFQQYFSYIMVVSFICGGKRRKPLTRGELRFSGRYGIHCQKTHGCILGAIHELIIFLYRCRGRSYLQLWIYSACIQL